MMWKEHLEYLKAVFKQLEAANLKIIWSKCEFFKTKVHDLGFLVGMDGVQPLPEKVVAVQALQPLKDVNELMEFLGLVGFYRKFISFFCRYNHLSY